jgi:hypothetical protein
MRLSRTLNVVVVVFVLLAVAVPAAQAGTLERSERVLSPVDGSWLAASMSWLAQLFGFDRQEPQAVQKVGVLSAIEPPPVRPMTGSCIDPLGGTGTGGTGGGGLGGGGFRPCNL